MRGNDPFLYGEKVKAYLRRGAKTLSGFTEYPNPQVGYSIDMANIPETASPQGRRFSCSLLQYRKACKIKDFWI